MKLDISTNLKLPAEDFLESAIGIIGKRGRGKSGLVKVLMEELVHAGLPFVAFDPVGVMWGLRSSFDGKGPGLPVLIVGGSHGDLRLERRAGAEIAKSVVQANISCIIDFSEESKSVYREFVRDFSHTLFAINDSPRIVIIEEAPELVPQRLRPDMMDVFEAVERLVSRGRNKGLGVVLVSQRAATINKDVLTQVDALFLFGLVSPQDRKAVAEWVEAHDVKGKLEEFEAGIAGLVRQEAWFWAPEAFSGVFKKIHVRDFTTFHPDKTHLRRTGMLASKPVTTDVTEIVAKLGAQLERLSKEKSEKTELPKARVDLAKLKVHYAQLEKTVADLRTKLASRPASGSELRRAVEEATRDLRKELNDTRLQLKRSTSAIVRVRGIAKTLIEVSDSAALGEDVLKMEKAVARPPPPHRTIAPLRAPAVRVVRDPESLQEGEIRLRSGAIRILKEMASRHPMTLTRAQVAQLTEFTASGGTFQTYMSELRRLGYFEEDVSGSVHVTPIGLEAAGEVPPMPSTHEEIMSRWKQSFRKGAGDMLQAIVDAGQEGITIDELAEKTGFTASGGTFQTYLSELRRNNLIEIEKEDYGKRLRATELLFP